MMQHRGRRSEFNAQRRFAKALVSNSARHDRVQAEQICMLDRAEVLDALSQKFGPVAVGSFSFERGEVIVDSRGRGSLQLPSDYRDWLLAIE
jgi:hypothetical protein